MLFLILIKTLPKHKLHLFCFCFCMLAAQIVPAQDDFNFGSLQTQSYQNYLRLNSDFSEHHFNPTTKDGISIYLSNYADILQLLVSEDFELFKKLSPNQDIRLEILEKMNQNSPYYLFTQAEIKLQWAIVKLKYGDKIAAVWILRQAYKDLIANEKKFPDFLPTKKSLGLLQVLFAAVPQKYQWAMQIIGLKTDIKKGFDNLNQVIENQGVYSLEASIFDVLLHVYILEKKELAFKKLVEIRQGEQQNLVIDFVSAMIFVKIKKQKEAEVILEKLSLNPNCNLKIPYLTYLKAEIELYKGDYQNAKLHYTEFLKIYKGKNFIKDTYYKLFLADWLAKRIITSKQKKKHFDLIRNHGFELNQVDKYASEFIKNDELSHIDLMRARLFFDGGNFQKSLLILEQIETEELESIAEQTELIYRKARAYHELKQENSAIKFYKQSIQLGRGLPEYFAAYSALQLGYLFQKQNSQLAKKYFEQALNLPKKEYKSSIDNKSKAALNELD